MKHTEQKPNIHSITGIAYGYLLANDLDADVIDAIFSAETKDLTFEEFMADNLSLEDFQAWKDGEPSDEVMALGDDYDAEERVFESEYEGVKLRSSYLGGALHFFVLESPHLTNFANTASMCVPNAGILTRDQHGEVECYSVPNDWWSMEA